MTPEEIEEYHRGYNDNERARNFKNWEYDLWLIAEKL
jgi:hypothetical protein